MPNFKLFGPTIIYRKIRIIKSQNAMEFCVTDEDYIKSLARSLQTITDLLEGPLKDQTCKYLDTVIEVYPKLANNEEWKKDQKDLMEDFVYQYLKRDLIESGVSGEICQTNESFLKFLKYKSAS